MNQRLRKEKIEQAFWQWADDAVECEVIFMDDDGPKPRGPYVTLKIIVGPMRIGTTDEMEHLENDDYEIIGRREITMNVQAFGCGAFDIITDLQMSLSEPEVIEFFQSQKIGIVSEGSPTDLTALRDTKHEERVSIDIRALVVDVKVVRVGTIEKVKVTGETDTLISVLETEQTIEAP